MGAALSKPIINLLIIWIQALRITSAPAPIEPLFHPLRADCDASVQPAMSHPSPVNLRIHPQRRYLTKRFRTTIPKSDNRWDIVLPEFHFFGRLPPEVRFLIWEAARPDPRVVKISQVKPDKGQGSYGAIYSKAKVPSLLHACSESRRVALQWYELSFGHRLRSPGTMYFDQSVDFAYFQCQKCRGRFHACDRNTCGLGLLSYVTREQVKRVVYESDAEFDPVFSLWFNFPAAEEVLLVEAGKGLGLGVEASLSSFTCNTAVFPWQEGKDLLTYYNEQMSNWQTVARAERPLKKITSVQLGNLPVKRKWDTLKGEEPIKRLCKYPAGHLPVKRKGDTLEKEPSKRRRKLPPRPRFIHRKPTRPSVMHGKGPKCRMRLSLA
ncbi:hypothetical protein BDZ45DRAFT_751939 [Acephala macrosclerotiorum]|nr:hypothetical protein BDZ45DRAFT_751939 [Acephala macrosclerotiorum]